MKLSMLSDWNRRRFFLGLGWTSLLAALRPGGAARAYGVSRRGEIYRQIGVRPLINAAGTYTTLTGSVMPPAVRQAMADASEVFVPLLELQQAVGDRIARLLQIEGAMVTSGAAGSILLATAACITGKDPEKVRRLPDTAGMKNEVIMPKEQRMGFDKAVAVAGGRIVDVETVEQLRRAIHEKTAMLFWVNIFEHRTKIPRADFLAAGKQAGVPVFNDAAAELPPAENLSGLVREGYDLVAFSGGKGLRGPQASGLLLGRKDLIEAAHLNNNPHGSAVGRPMKVGKEEIMGLLVAVELYTARDHEADQWLWRSFMERIADHLQGLPTLETEVYMPGPGGHPIPYLRVQWSESKLGLTYSECQRLLREGEPRIEVNMSREEGLSLASYNLFPGEEEVVGQRLRRILGRAASHAAS